MTWPTLPTPDHQRRAQGFRVQTGQGANKGPLGVSVLRAEAREASTLRVRIAENGANPVAGLVRVAVDGAAQLVSQSVEIPSWGVAIPVSAGFVELSVDGFVGSLEATVSPGAPLLRPEPRTSYGATTYAPGAAIVAPSIPDWAVRAKLRLLDGGADVLGYIMAAGDTIDLLPAQTSYGLADAGAGAVMLWSWEVVW